MKGIFAHDFASKLPALLARKSSEPRFKRDWGLFSMHKPLPKTKRIFIAGLLSFCIMNDPDSGRPASPHRIGYARVSSVGQNLDAQLDALKQAGCSKSFSDKMTGPRMERPGWNQLMAYLRPGDTLVVAELSRLTRSLLDLLETGRTLERRDIHLVSLREHIDTNTATGRCFLSMMGAIHQMERELKAERAAAGRSSAKARGRTGGRPRTAPEKLEQARILYQNSDKTAADVCRMTGVGRRKLFAYLAEKSP